MESGHKPLWYSQSASIISWVSAQKRGISWCSSLVSCVDNYPFVSPDVNAVESVWA